MTDQQLFIIVTLGAGQMPEIGENLLIDQRWDVINYVRTLQ